MNCEPKRWEAHGRTNVSAAKRKLPLECQAETAKENPKQAEAARGCVYHQTTKRRQERAHGEQQASDKANLHRPRSPNRCSHQLISERRRSRERRAFSRAI